MALALPGFTTSATAMIPARRPSAAHTLKDAAGDAIRATNTARTIEENR